MPRTKKLYFYYRRDHCATCAKSDAYLAAHGYRPMRSADARKARINAAEALELARSVRRVVSMRGRAVSLLELNDSTTDAELRTLVIGPTGNLRAPTVRKGNTLLIGFDEATYVRELP